MAGNPVRHIAIALYPSAEFAGDGGAGLRETATRFLDRLSPVDQVQLLLPDGERAWLSPAQATAAISRIAMQPIPARDMTLPPVSSEIQQLYRFGPPGLRKAHSDSASGCDVPVADTISVPCSLGPVTVEALAAEPLPDGSTQVFFALRNRTPVHQAVMAYLTVYDIDGSHPQVRPCAIQLEPRSRVGQTTTWQGFVEAIGVELSIAGDKLPHPFATAYAAKQVRSRIKIALVGLDEPLVRRYISADENLQLMAEPSQADVVIANAAPAPRGQAAIIINPAEPPPGCRMAKVLNDADLGSADLAADHPVMRHVDLGGVQARTLQTWRIDASMAGEVKTLAALDNQAFIAVQEPAGPSADAKRVYVGMDVSADNTNLGAREAFVILLANAVRYLAGPAMRQSEFSGLSPADVGRDAAWTRVVGHVPHQSVDSLPWPGLYHDFAGHVRAVSVAGLAADEAVEAGIETERASLPLPQVRKQSVELWPGLLGIATALWLGGWAWMAWYSRPTV